MSVSTDAILFYGYCWSDECELLEEYRDDDGDVVEWPEVVLRRRGASNPWQNYPNEEICSLPYAQQRAAGDRWCEEHRAELDAWDKARKAVEKQFGVEIGRHCSDGCPMPYVAIANTESIKAGTSARRGYPEDVTGLILEANPKWDTKLDRFLAELGIKKPHKRPQWWLVSWWG